MAHKALGPASLAVVQAVQQVLDDEGHNRIAVSGGADSMALAVATRHVAASRGIEVEAMVVDHGIHPRSAQVSEVVVDRLARLGVPARAVRVQVVESGDGLEAAARDARYEALLDGEPDRVLLGHTMDDQAESVLLGLVRGSGTRSLAGMPAQRGPIRRPLLSLRRDVTRRACEEWGVDTWQDPANDDERFARVRVRRLLPVLEAELGPGIVESLARTAWLAGRDADALDALAAAAGGDMAAPDEGLCVDTIENLPDALRTRVIRSWLGRFGVASLSMERTLAVDALVTAWRGQAGVDLPGGKRVRRQAGRLVVS